jgi:hypothetical protein
VSSPIQSFLDWFNGLPPNQRTDIAALVMGFSPLFGSIDPARASDVSKDFIAGISKYLGSGTSEVGVMLALRATVDFFAIRNRATRESWDEVQHRNLAMKAVLEQRGDESRLTEFIEDQNRQLPLRREQWLGTAAKWKDLCNSSLSDESLVTWFESTLQQSRQR